MRTLGLHARAGLTGVFLLILLGTLALPSSAQLSGTGTIAGRVTDDNGKPLSYANVIIVGTQWGAFSLDDGTYQIQNVPVGTYTLQVTMLGYEDQRIENITVAKGETAKADFKTKSKPVGTLQEVEIVARREVIKTKSAQQGHDISSKDVGSLPVDEINDLISLKAGVIARGGELHFRGGRGGEVQYQVDGVPVRDPLVGGGVSLAALAVENTEQIMGGLDAQYGNAQSGVVNYKTKEGGEQFEGDINYQTDDYGQPDNTFDNLDKIFLGIGGPSPIKKLTYYVSGEGTFSDSYPKTIRNRTHHRVLNFISIGDRQENSVRFQGKLAFKPASAYKLTAEYINNHGRNEAYYHIWSRDGYVQQIRRTTQQGEVVVRNGRWSPTQVDSTYVYYNAADHTPLFMNNFDQLKLIWNHTLDAATYYTVKLNRNHFYSDTRVNGKQAWEYTGEREQDFWFNYTDNNSSDFFVIAGDYPVLSNRETLVYSSKADLTKKIKKHTFQTGVEATYNDMRYYQVSRPYTTRNGEIGSRTRYHYYNPEGALYLQDRWEHEGMVLNMGLRYDIFSVGQQFAVGEVSERVKQQFSPRIGIAYPISDRDVFNFHYGRFYQIPDRRFIFDNQNVYDGSAARGNPNLTNETTVSYQAGIQHLFNEVISGQFSVYYKDIFGLVTQDQRPATGSVVDLTSYVNKDYASARGFEATLTRRFSNNFAGEINYAFGVATGVASDPNAQSQQAFTYLPISEQPLNWDVRHTIRVQLMIADLGKWLTSFIWQYDSGFPYTPWGRNTRELKPEVVNSRRLPGTTSLDVQAEKYYQVWGQRFKIFLQSRNVLDSKNITDLSPGNWPLPPGRSGNDYDVYYTETGRAGGAYVGEDVNGDGIGDWVPVNDPRVFGDPRSIRMGISYSF